MCDSHRFEESEATEFGLLHIHPSVFWAGIFANLLGTPALQLHQVGGKKSSQEFETHKKKVLL